MLEPKTDKIVTEKNTRVHTYNTTKHVILSQLMSVSMSTTQMYSRMYETDRDMVVQAAYIYMHTD